MEDQNKQSPGLQPVSQVSGWSPSEAKTEPITLLLSHGFSRQQYVKAGGTGALSVLDGGVIYFFLDLLTSEEATYTIPELTDPERIGDLLPVLQQINKQNKSVGLEIIRTHVFSPIRALAWSFFLPDSRQG